MGSGRSGTSMMAGVLAGAGYYMGARPMPADFRSANPKGLFEDFEVSEINEELLDPLFPTPARTRWAQRRQARKTLGPGERWAATLPRDAVVSPSSELDARIAALVATQPFCFKDPRFCYTLPAWRPHVEDAVLVCVFREPARTANSLVTEWQSADWRTYEMTFERGLAHWREAYRRVLDLRAMGGEWLFLHYDQILDGSGVGRLEATLGVSVDHEFPETSLNRSPVCGEVRDTETSIYERLCELAGAGASQPLPR